MTGQGTDGSRRPGAGRRSFLSAVGTTALSGLAGCSSGILDDVTGTDAAGTGPNAAGATDRSTATPHGMNGPKAEHSGWPRYHYDTWNTGHRTDPVDFDGRPAVEWETPVGEVTSLVAADGIVYLAEARTGVIRAVEAASGEERWTYDAVGTLELGVKSVALDDDTVYVGGGAAVHAIDQATGEQRWTFEISTAATAPVVADGTVYVGAGEVLFAIDPNGEREWALRTGARLRNPPAVVEDTLYLTAKAWLIAVDRASGDELWSLKPANATPPVTAPVYRAGRLYVGAPLHVHAYDPAAEGDHLWSTESLNQVIYDSPAVANGQVYTSVGQGDTLFAFDAGTGERTWDRSITLAGSPIVVDDAVYCVDVVAGTLRTFDATDGSDRWTLDFDRSVNVQPIVTDDRIYVAGRDSGGDEGTLYALGAQ